MNPPHNASATEHVARTVRYRAMMEDRRNTLRRNLASILRPQEPVTLELGCGHGHFLTAYAEANPAKLCIGIDLISDRITRALRKRDRAKVGNLHFIQAEATMFFQVLPENIPLTELFIMFPDPWPKARHHKHRIVRANFLTAAARTMLPQGLLCFRTDFKPYFDDVVRVVSHHSQWSPSTEPWPFEHPTVFQGRASTYYSLTARRRPREQKH